MTDMIEISLDELDRRIQKHGPRVALSNVHVSGIAVIKDKDGNIKSEMQITSLEFNDDTEEDDNAVSNGSA